MLWLFCTKPVSGFEDLYRVSAGGVVESRHSGEWQRLRPGRSSDGYLTVGLCRNGKQKTHNVHQLVAEAFIGPKQPGLETRHLDGDPSNNKLSNLAYGTSAENEADKVRHGTASRGERNGQAKLDANTVQAIRFAVNVVGMTKTAVAKRFGVSWPQVFDIVRGRRWAWLPEEFDDA